MGTYKYPAEFRADAVALVRSSDRPVAQIAKELGVNHETLRQWVKAADAAGAAAGGTAASGAAAVADPAKDAEISRLRRQVRELEMERDILRKAAKYFATETNW